MHTSYALRLAAAVLLSGCIAAGATEGQSVGNVTSLNGSVVDATGAIILGATVKIHNPMSGFDRSTETDTTGQFSFTNVPFNPYHLTVTAKGFSSYYGGCGTPLQRTSDLDDHSASGRGSDHYHST
ncbi:MAG: carboxypeptidase-like regulatory domain-containing protein [Candidatus Sulfotelmatobacter sp.]